MWGQSQVINIANLGDGSGPSGSFGRKTTNLLNINYGRPDTWRLMLGVKIEFLPGFTFVGQPAPTFHLAMGLGLLNYQISNVWQPQFAALGPYEAYSTRLTGLTDVTGVTPQQNFIDLDQIPAQSLQVIGQFDYQGSGSAVVTMVAMAAPISHIRPDWYQGRFSSELGGT
jgi:hypothetical protein